MSHTEWGHYVVIRVGDSLRDEWTNIGIMIFNRAGDQIAARMDNLDRAIRRGDIRADSGQGFIDHVQQYPELFLNMNLVRKTLDSVSHSMSVLQMTQPRATSINDVDMDVLWRLFIEK